MIVSQNIVEKFMGIPLQFFTYVVNILLMIFYWVKNVIYLRTCRISNYEGMPISIKGSLACHIYCLHPFIMIFLTSIAESLAVELSLPVFTN